MGWWSTDVHGGDAALDALDGLECVLAAGDLYPLTRVADPVLVRDRLLERLPQVLERLDGEGVIGLQVLGAVAAAVGAVLPAEVVDRVLAAVDADEWAVEDEGRAESMCLLREAVLGSVSGAPVVLETTGLFESMALMSLSGQSGLVNLPGPGSAD